jgi:PPP family 3-phenylpropionic acid transporter
LGFLIAVYLVGRALDPQAAVPLPACVAFLLFVTFLASLPLPGRPGPARLPVAAETPALLRSPSFVVFLAISFLAYAAHSSYDLCFSLHLRDLGAADRTTGLCWAAGTFFEVVLLRFGDRICARFSPPRLLVFALAGAAGRWTIFTLVRSVPVLLALSPLHAVSFATWWLASVAHVKARAPAHALAAAQGLFAASMGAGTVLGMLVWGPLYRRAGGEAVFAVAAAVSLSAAILAVGWSAWTESASARRKTFDPPHRAG